MLQQMYRLPDVIKVTGLSRSSIYLAISKNQFPKPIKIGRRSIGWPEKILQEWIKKMERDHENS